MSTLVNRINYVSCPNCGALTQKSITTESFVTCKKCKTEYYVYVQNGTILETPAANIQDLPFYSTVQSFQRSVERLASAEARR